jgi:large conductance mechanosensitive channel
MTSGFKQFVLRGNVVDMAVGVVVGGAFTAVVAALTKDLLTPLIAALVVNPTFRQSDSRCTEVSLLLVISSMLWSRSC